MAAASWIQYCYHAFAAQPKCDRQLYRLAKRERLSRIVEVGIDNLDRSARLIEVAQRYAGEQKVCYSGLDCFEARPQMLPSLALKQAYCRLQATGAQVRLVPGIPGRSLAAVANAHQNTGLLLISTLVTDDDLKDIWFYVPRMLNQKSLVLRADCDTDGQASFMRLDAAHVTELAGRSAKRRAA